MNLGPTRMAFYLRLFSFKLPICNLLMFPAEEKGGVWVQGQ